jgi:anaerobic selenocysteine-containing dehydrogenase
MNLEVSRRNFLKGAGVAASATALGALGFEEAEAAHRNAEHLSLLFSRLRRHSFLQG